MEAGKWKAIAIWATVLMLGTVLVAVIAAGCGSDADTSAGPLALTEEDNGKAFTVSVGDTVTVVLAGNPTTGYEWATDMSEADTALLEPAGDPVYVADTVDTNIVGSGGKYTFTFTAAAKGEAELSLKYWRSFEEDVEPIQSFTATITIE
jgi:predicted secreted protein